MLNRWAVLVNIGEDIYDLGFRHWTKVGADKYVEFASREDKQYPPLYRPQGYTVIRSNQIPNDVARMPAMT